MIRSGIRATSPYQLLVYLSCVLNKFLMGYTACTRLIRGDRDMVEIEKVIVRQLGGENHRCAFFRSVPYIRLRIAALYLPNPTQHVAYCGDLCVTLMHTEEGPLVSVHCSYEPTYPDDFQPSPDIHSTPPASTCLKRMRVE